MGRYTVMGMFVSVVWRLLKKLKIELPYDPAVPFLGIYPKECKPIQSRYLSTQFIAPLFTMVKLWSQPKCLTTSEWMKRMWCVHTMECYSSMKKNEIYHLQENRWSRRAC
jgi:hypothetical protein